ncbi:MAG: nucleotide exchange factor GrpE [Candidatus Saccharibacteria bacterium]|jgi:grpE|nr:nucleotide exchange factor GrpE [TM7 phylum sp. oral taxon 350]
MKKDKKEKAEELEKKIEELTNDLIRTRADFENYRKRVESEKEQAKVVAKSAIISKLLPIIDDIELAISYAPENLKDNPWVKGVNKLSLKLETSLSNLGVKTIDAKSNTTFDPKLHDAISMDDSSEGEEEIILEELRKGYLYNDAVIRPSMVKVGFRNKETEAKEEDKLKSGTKTESEVKIDNLEGAENNKKENN